MHASTVCLLYSVLYCCTIASAGVDLAREISCDTVQNVCTLLHVFFHCASAEQSYAHVECNIDAVIRFISVSVCHTQVLCLTCPLPGQFFPVCHPQVGLCRGASWLSAVLPVYGWVTCTEWQVYLSVAPDDAH